MTIEELFGTLQQSVVATWRKHLRTHKYSKHMALNDFYEEMPDKVDDLIEAWMGVNGKKVKSFDNIIKSKNMGTLAYLKELRKVVKDGYSLMNGEKELEAILDDIVELIDSTLYKVKELSEGKKMIELKDFINESLQVNESKMELAFVWSHDDPSTMYCMNGNVDGLEKELKDYDYNVNIMKVDSNLITICWNDEMMWISDVPGSNLNDAKRKELQYIDGQLKEQADAISQDGYVYIESNLFGGANEWDDAKEDDKADKYLDRFIEMIEDSEVDGDSSYARSVVDVRKGKVLLGNSGVVFMTGNEFRERLADEE